MENETLTLNVKWKPIRFSKYLRGVVQLSTPVQDRMMVGRIFKHSESGQIRIYSGMNLDYVRVVVNDGSPKIMRARGRFGRLHISE